MTKYPLCTTDSDGRCSFAGGGGDGRDSSGGAGGSAPSANGHSGQQQQQQQDQQQNSAAANKKSPAKKGKSFPYFLTLTPYPHWGHPQPPPPCRLFATTCWRSECSIGHQDIANTRRVIGHVSKRVKELV